MLLLVWACANIAPGDAQRYRAGLVSGECTGIATVVLRDDCLLAAEACEEIQGSLMRDECWFQRAETKKDPRLCAQAGQFSLDCQMHVLSQGFAAWVPADAQPGQIEGLAAQKIQEAGFATDDPRPWSALYRWVLGQQKPLNRQECLKITDPARQDACLHTGIALYNDRLNQARDRHLFPCDASQALPPLLQSSPDPDLDALRASRSDLCP